MINKIILFSSTMYITVYSLSTISSSLPPCFSSLWIIPTIRRSCFCIFFWRQAVCALFTLNYNFNITNSRYDKFVYPYRATIYLYSTSDSNCYSASKAHPGETGVWVQMQVSTVYWETNRPTRQKKQNKIQKRDTTDGKTVLVSSRA